METGDPDIVDKGRKELLLKMYDQMFADINRHILVIWQSVGVLIGAFAIFALVEKHIVPVDVATSLIVLLSSWLLAHLYDAAYWYNRNLVIIANIERQFLDESDLRDIHYYFGAHRPRNKMMTHLRIQFALGIGIGGVLIVFHFATRIVPGLVSLDSELDPQRALPYLTLVASVIYLIRIKINRKQSYDEFLKNSPGKSINTTETTFGIGHGHKRQRRWTCKRKG